MLGEKGEYDILKALGLWSFGSLGQEISQPPNN